MLAHTCHTCAAAFTRPHNPNRPYDYPELRLDVGNGRTLCVPCHLATPTFGNRRQSAAVGQEA
jgi:hypothetical protein